MSESVNEAEQPWDVEAVKAKYGFDPAALKQKYLHERDRRRRADGNDQYLEVTGDFAHYVDDPYVDQLNREPKTDEVDVIIIGGGFGGQLAAARLQRAGIQDLRIIEKGGDFGGTWYWNRYPGAQCDIEAYIYLPMLEEVGYVPKEKYAFAPEILDHAKAIGKTFDLYPRTLFQTEATAVVWQEEQGLWLISTNRGDALRARYVVMSNGPLNRPKLPGIAGVDTFKGHSFHTSRWDYRYTGGDTSGNLTNLADKRVAVIGTGATAVQCVPHLGKWAKELYVFQRTPSSVDVRGNKPTDPEWAERLQPGWQKERMNNFNTLVTGGMAAEDLVNDGWTDIIRNLLIMVKDESQPDLSPEAILKKLELADFQKMEQVRSRAQELVDDPATAEALKPYYRQFCKRPCFHDDYLPTFNRPNVKLIDTQGQGVEEITANAVVANGETYEVDCLIFATGFEVGTSYTRRSGYEVTGVGGQTLSEKWADGVATLHGLTTRGFPNCFILSNTQGGFTANYPHMLDEQVSHLAYIIGAMHERQKTRFEPSAEAEQAWVDTIIDKARLATQFLEECTPGYYNNEGKSGERTAQNAQYGGGPVEFFGLLAKWRDAGNLPGLELS